MRLLLAVLAMTVWSPLQDEPKDGSSSQIAAVQLRRRSQFDLSYWHCGKQVVKHMGDCVLKAATPCAGNAAMSRAVDGSRI